MDEDGDQGSGEEGEGDSLFRVNPTSWREEAEGATGVGGEVPAGE